MGAVLEEMMEGLALDESSTFYEDYDPAYEFDACKFFDFCVDETDYEIRQAERWFRYAQEYPPAPYMVKINLTKILKSIPANVLTPSSSKLEADEHVNSTSPVITSSYRSMPSSEEKTKGALLSENDGRMQWRFRDVQLLTEYLIRRDELSGHGNFSGSGLKYHNLTADDHSVKAKSKSGNKSSSKPSRTFMKPTASHLAKQIKMIDVHTSSCGRSNKLESPIGYENEDTKKQKLETGFLRKAEHLETSSNSRSKITIPQKPKLMTEERAQRRRSQIKPEANINTFKALPLNRKILESPSLPMHKKKMPQYSPEFQVLKHTSRRSELKMQSYVFGDQCDL
ncbi:hypothetical protein L6452_14690 [Arctium lappa]|uniref:Uncharacterized protein n=1 Tax=Arctium lappa TaxID=4217 RepID=A0ACB9CLX2_ARCLA|nr:hypothetical protein L6452_14690 [Arctium lappa]